MRVICFYRYTVPNGTVIVGPLVAPHITGDGFGLLILFLFTFDGQIWNRCFLSLLRGPGCRESSLPSISKSLKMTVPYFGPLWLGSLRLPLHFAGRNDG
jgi:hypothetical protein